MLLNRKESDKDSQQSVRAITIVGRKHVVESRKLRERVNNEGRH